MLVLRKRKVREYYDMARTVGIGKKIWRCFGGKGSSRRVYQKLWICISGEKGADWRQVTVTRFGCPAYLLVKKHIV